MREAKLIQGRMIGEAEVAQIQRLVAEHPQWSRWRSSREVAHQWNWRTGTGQLKDMAARTLLLKLEQRGQIILPPRRQKTFSRMRQQVPPPAAKCLDAPLALPLSELVPLEFLEVSTVARAAGRRQFAALLHQHHYLSYRSPVGENLQYLVRDRQGRLVACVLFGAAAWQCAERDRWIGWAAARRAQQLHLLTNNTRFLILPWVRVPHLASHVLSRIARRLSRDWQAKYGHPIYLLETFVERERFAGTCYQAANWRHVGQTKGRSRQDRAEGGRKQVPIKDIYLYPLHPRFREQLQGTAATTSSSPL